MSGFPRRVRGGGAELRLAAKHVGPDRYAIRVGDRSIEVDARACAGGGFTFGESGTRAHRAFVAAVEGGLQVRVDGRTWFVESTERSTAGRGHAQQDAEPTRVTAPMTGTIVRVCVCAGDEAEVGQDLVILSAMKMEHRLRASIAATVAEVCVREGETVDEGALVVRLSRTGS